MPPMQDNKWYVAGVEVPPDLDTQAQITAFLEDLAQGLARADHRMKGSATKPADYPTTAAAKTAADAPAASGLQPLYFCHNKF